MIPSFIIEHCEPRLYTWSFIEYVHISSIVGKENLWFTHTRSSKLTPFGKTIPVSVTTLQLANACILDPFAKKTLQPNEHFDHYIFGGILGDDPPSKKTELFLTKKAPQWQARNLGREQMATDNATYVVKKITEGVKLNDIAFVNTIELNIRNGESIILPYKYILVDGKPLLSPELVRMLKAKRGF